MAAITDALTRRLLRPPFPYSAPSVPDGVEIPEAPPRSGPDYDTDWARRYPARLARAALVETVGRGLVAALARPRVSGLDRLDTLADRDHAPRDLRRQPPQPRRHPGPPDRDPRHVAPQAVRGGCRRLLLPHAG